ncbi:ABC transporter substrate binding protein [Methanofollis fontis]|uniref:Histidine kinase n=1 Tax=Methanofollis fontis TaxID=2052832 RepID=A0A483CZ13_9EURY|nr:ABC transporter substrate binding protein [Methanofollis fontis]TAJ45532.1 hypothetical protein CUJ86_02055 [Methanofollis fontis]
MLILSSYNQGFEWTDDVIDGALSVLPPDADTDVHIEYMDTKRASGEDYFDHLLEVYRIKYRSDPPDVIIADEEDAYRFLVEHRDDLFPGAPVVVTGLNWRPDRTEPGYPGFTGVMEDYEIMRTIDLALDLHPGTEHLVIVNDNISMAGKENDLLLKDIIPHYQNWIGITEIKERSLQDLGTALEKIPENSVVLLLTYNTDADGRVFTYDETAALVTAMTDAPVYGVWDFYVGDGIVGGWMTRGCDQGMTGGEMARAILDGTPVEEIPAVVATPQQAIFDYRQLLRFDIPESALPPESTVLYRPDTTIEVPVQTLAVGGFMGLVLIGLLATLVLTNRQLKGAEQRARVNEERLTMALEASKDGIWEWNLQDNTTYFSPTYYRMLGYEPGEFPSSFTTWEAMIHPDDLDQTISRLRSALEPEGPPYKTEFRLHTKEGGWRWVLGRGQVMEWQDGTPLRMVGTHVDITERKRTELELDIYRQHLEDLVGDRTAELDRTIADLQTEVRERTAAEERLAAETERLSVTLRSIGDGVITTDTAGNILLINRAAEVITGWSDAEARGKALSEVLRIFDEKSRTPVADPVRKVMLENAIVEIPDDTVLIRRDGTERLIADSAAPVRGSDSRILGVVIVFRDVTGARHAEEERIRNQKLESVGLLAGGIAHDFNNFLMAVLGNLQIAMDGVDPEEERFGYLREAESALFRARDLTTQLLTFARGGAPVRQSRRLEEMIRETATFTLRGSHTRASCEIDENLWPVDVDIGQISQVVQNLVLNASQAMPDGGTVTIRARNRDLTDEVPDLPAGRYVAVEVIDTGVGIASQNLQRIFDPYFTTRPDGRGLGLSSCLSIVRKHDGTIEVSSTPGEGTTFTVYLPATEKPPIIEESEIDDLAMTERGRVLVMDDEHHIRDVITVMLEKRGFSVDAVPDGETAITAYQRAIAEGKPYNSVILDLTVPGGMGGREAIFRLKELDPSVRAIVSSGYSQDPVMAEYEAFGFAAAIQKPFRMSDLVATLDRLAQNGQK